LKKKVLLHSSKNRTNFIRQEEKGKSNAQLLQRKWGEKEIAYNISRQNPRIDYETKEGGGFLFFRRGKKASPLTGKGGGGET